MVIIELESMQREISAVAKNSSSTTDTAQPNNSSLLARNESETLSMDSFSQFNIFLTISSMNDEHLIGTLHCFGLESFNKSPEIVYHYLSMYAKPGKDEYLTRDY